MSCDGGRGKDCLLEAGKTHLCQGYFQGLVAHLHHKLRVSVRKMSWLASHLHLIWVFAALFSREP